LIWPLWRTSSENSKRWREPAMPSAFMIRFACFSSRSRLALTRAAGTGVPVLKALGAAPVGMPMPEVPQAVQTRVIDGTMTSREVLKDFKLAGALKFVTDYPTVVVTFAAVMDAKRWGQLPADVQKVIDALGPDFVMYASDYPHWDGDWPESTAHLRTRADISDGSRAKIGGANAQRFYGLDA